MNNKYALVWGAGCGVGLKTFPDIASAQEEMKKEFLSSLTDGDESIKTVEQAQNDSEYKDLFSDKECSASFGELDAFVYDGSAPDGSCNHDTIHWRIYEL